MVKHTHSPLADHIAQAEMVFNGTVISIRQKDAQAYELTLKRNQPPIAGRPFMTTNVSWHFGPNGDYASAGFYWSHYDLEQPTQHNGV